MVYALLITLTLSLVVLIWRVVPRRSSSGRIGNHFAAEVHEQHVYLFQGGPMSESQLESARATMQEQLEEGEKETILAAMKNGLGFAVQVRALVQIGTPEAIQILGQHLRRSITSDTQEQAWYWLDVVCGLRQLKHYDCLPLVFDCVEKSPTPLNQFLSAEAVCFPGFIDCVDYGDASLRAQATRILHLALVSLRSGVQPQVVIEARIGEAIAALWNCRWEDVDPLAVRVFYEATRLQQRAGHFERLLAQDESSQERFRDQIQRIDALADSLRDWLQEARETLVERLPKAPPDLQSDLLHALIDIRADTSRVVLPMLEADEIVAEELAVESLAYSQQPGVGEWLCLWLRENQSPRSRWRRRSWQGSNAGLSLTCQSVLHTLKYFPCEECERLLVSAAMARDRDIRLAALGSLGWYEPLDRDRLLNCLRKARMDQFAGIQRAAQAALARLGERQALQWFRRQFAAENSDCVHHVLDLIAREGILLLWPDLDHLTDAQEADIAHHACETLELLREDFIPSCSVR